MSRVPVRVVTPDRTAIQRRNLRATVACRAARSTHDAVDLGDVGGDRMAATTGHEVGGDG